MTLTINVSANEMKLQMYSPVAGSWALFVEIIVTKWNFLFFSSINNTRII